MKKTYIIVGDNNYWYSHFEAEFAHEVTAELEFVKQCIAENQYDTSIPSELNVYEANRVTTIKL